MMIDVLSLWNLQYPQWINKQALFGRSGRTFTSTVTRRDHFGSPVMGGANSCPNRKQSRKDTDRRTGLRMTHAQFVCPMRLQFEDNVSVDVNVSVVKVPIGVLPAHARIDYRTYRFKRADVDEGSAEGRCFHI